MRTINRYFAVSLAAIALFISGRAVSAAPVKPEKSVEQKVMSKLRGLPNYGVFDNITYTVNGSTVTLTGKVITLGTKGQAERAVKDIKGITNVVNDIDELPLGSFDNRIRYAALQTFVNRGPAQYFSGINPDVRIIVENGRITLEGYVSNRSDSNLLNLLANGISGVFQVTNNLVVGRDSRRS